ncbi:trypsin-like peptidase domain-containing protein [Desulfobulbus sp. F3]|nr:trypsin-like peptidase domain-containing protein [Desulfobulbus sp. F3]
MDRRIKRGRPGESFPVEELLEYRIAGLDFAIVRLGRNAAGRLPGEIYGRLQLALKDIIQPGAMLCLIQHPSGRPKQIEAGPMLRNRAGQIAYDSLDTEGGSSGAPILSLDGELVGVHTNGGCSAFSGFNYGVTITAIRTASSIVN